jgi:hypothetical protein
MDVAMSSPRASPGCVECGAHGHPRSVSWPGLRIGIRAVSDLLERRFAEFAGVPYRSPVSRQQWEELWEAEAETSRR